MHSQTSRSAAASAAITAAARQKSQTRRFSPEPARQRHSATLDTAPAPLIVVSPFDEDFLSLLEILKPADWTVYRCSNQADAMNMLGANSVPVVLCERELPEGDWQSLAAEAQSLPQPPRIVITAVLADERLWVEALNLGAHDVLRKPFDASEVNRVVTYARQFWNAARGDRKRNAKRAKSA